jgi:hypothetical protein
LTEAIVEVAAEFARRERLARRALRIGAAAFVFVLVGSYGISRLTMSNWGPLVGMTNILLLLISPIALGIGVANLSTSDKLGMRIVYGLVAGAIVFVALAILAFQVYEAGGGKSHI